MAKRLVLKVLAVVFLAILLKIPLAMISGVLEERVVQREAATQSVMQSTSGPQRVAGVVLVVPYKVRHVTREKVPTTELVPVPASQPAVPPAAKPASPASAKPAAARRAAADSAPARAGEGPAATGSKADPGGQTLDAPATPAAGPGAQRARAAVATPTPPEPRYTSRTVIRLVTKETFSDHVLTVLPEDFRISGTVATNRLYRGIYAVPVYATKLTVSGTFSVDVGKLRDDPNVRFGEPYVAVGLGDVRGLRQAPNFTWQGKTFAVQPGAKLSAFGEGVHVPLTGVKVASRRSVAFSLPLDLAGATKLSFAPLGRNARVDLRADWPHPSFYGRFLPTQRTVDAAGFTARWETTALASNLGARFRAAHKSGRALAADHDVGVSFIEPVDHYSQTSRATKYDLLFVLLTFSAFFLFEVVKQLRIHPMQYALVGAALATFYLLVIALSEHLGFTLAYVIASAACVGLIGHYLASVLASWRRGLGFSAGLATLYGALYGILQSEDQALLLGALLVFGGLATVMTVTRRLDWYSVGGRPVPDQA